MKIKKISFYCLSLLLVYFSLELFSFAEKTLLLGSISVNSDSFVEREFNFMRHQVIHPFIGYVTEPSANTPGFSEYGFWDTTSPLQRRSNGKIIIGIFGGSVARRFWRDGLDALKKEIRKESSFSNKEILFLNFSNGGYKQPQQLMILNYILALGGSFDIVINLDGFNEIALPVAENIPDGTFPFFPRRWKWRVAQEVSNDTEILTSAGIIRCREMQRNTQNLFSSAPLRYSFAAKLIGECLDRYLSRRISRDMEKLSRRGRDSPSNYTMTGPTRHYKSEQDMYQDLAEVWERCSLQMHKCCTANGIKYFHFLQPNQNVSNSKPIREAERRIAIRNQSPYRKPAEIGYPYLIKAGKNLVKDGVNFYDLTQVFANDNQPLYTDDCCHINAEGSSILGRVMGEAIVKQSQSGNAFEGK